MPSSSSDRNLLFGVVALQMDFIKRDQLIEAMTAWAVDKSKPLGQILVEKKYLSKDKRSLLEQLADAHVAAHDNDARKSLAALTSVSSLQRELSVVPDADVRFSISQLGMSPRFEDVKPARSEDDMGTRPAVTGDFSADKGRFEILRFHAAGGLGQVFIARDKELNRDVALKEIKPERAFDEDNQGRFLREAEITGGLEHPGIVPVYGLGHYTDGRPFYAMRFIKGESLYDRIEEFHQRGKGLSPSDRNLLLRELLGRFLDVCDAVQYAHDRGVLHRDLKPGNVMLGKYGETLVVDWGLAKAGQIDHFTYPPTAVATAETHREKHEEPLLTPSSGSNLPATVYGKGFGTIGYMAPEQAKGELDKLGPPADVYALGATLYCLLTGKSPNQKFDDDPNRVDAAVFRFRAPSELNPQVPKPLESICQKAMAVNIRDRYGSCSELANDVRQWLADEPVSAQPEKFVAKALRWSRKNPGPLAAIAATFLVGLASMFGGNLLLSGKNLELRNERDQTELARRNAVANEMAAQKLQTVAEANEKEAKNQKTIAENRRKEADAQRIAAQTERDIAVAVRNFLRNDLLRQSNPWATQALQRSGGKSTTDSRLNPTVLELLDRASLELAEDKIAKKFPNQLLQMEILETVAECYVGVNELDKAISLMKTSRTVHEAHFGSDHPESVASQISLAATYFRAQRILESATETVVGLRRIDRKMARHAKPSPTSKAAKGNSTDQSFQEGLQMIDAILKVAERQIDDSPDFGSLELDPKAIPMAMLRIFEAKAICERLLAAIESNLGPNDYHAHILHCILAFGDEAVGRQATALVKFEKAMTELETQFGQDHQLTTFARENVARLQRLEGHYQQSATNSDKLLRRSLNRLGPDHPSTLRATNNLAVAYYHVDKAAEAVPLLEASLAKQKVRLGSEHPDTLTSLSNLAQFYLMAGQLDKAVLVNEESLAKRKAKLGLDHPDTLTSMNNLAVAYDAAGMVDKAIALSEETLARQKARHGLDHPQTILSMSNLANAFRSAGKLDQAISLYEQALAKRKARCGAEHHETLQSMTSLANTFFAAGKLDKALPLYEETLAKRKAKLGPESALTLISMRHVAVTFAAAKRDREAEENYSAFVKTATSSSKPPTSQVRSYIPSALDWLISHHDKQGNKAEADKYREMRRKFPDAPKSDPKAAGGTSDGKQASQKKAGETKSSYPAGANDRRSSR